MNASKAQSRSLDKKAPSLNRCLANTSKFLLCAWVKCSPTSLLAFPPLTRYARPEKDWGYGWVVYPSLLKAQWIMEQPGFNPRDQTHRAEVTRALLAHTRRVTCLQELVEMCDRFQGYLTLPVVVQALSGLLVIYPKGLKTRERNGAGTQGEARGKSGAFESTTRSSSNSSSSTSTQSAAATAGAAGSSSSNGGKTADRAVMIRVIRQLLQESSWLLQPSSAAASDVTPSLVTRLLRSLVSLRVPAQHPLAAQRSRLTTQILQIFWTRLSEFQAEEVAGVLVGFRMLGIVLPGHVVGSTSTVLNSAPAAPAAAVAGGRGGVSSSSSISRSSSNSSSSSSSSSSSAYPAPGFAHMTANEFTQTFFKVRC